MKKIILSVVLVMFMSGCTWSDLVRVFVDLREDLSDLHNGFEAAVPDIQELCKSKALADTCAENDVDGEIIRIRGYLADAERELSQEKQDAAQATYDAAKVKVDELKVLVGL